MEDIIIMITLTRKENEVFCNGQKLQIIPQASKGPGNEAVRIEGLPGANGRKWIMLKSLDEGDNTIEVESLHRTKSDRSQNISLTDTERAEIQAHKDAIEAIMVNARKRQARYSNPLSLTNDELTDYIKYLENLKTEREAELKIINE